MEEYVKINLLSVILSPPKAPVRAQKIAMKNIGPLMIKDEIRMKGASFCHTKIKIFFTQEIDFITWGNQKWKGASPALMDREIKMIVLKFLNEKFVSWWAMILAEVTKKIEAMAWGKKYLIEDSVDF